MATLTCLDFLIQSSLLIRTSYISTRMEVEMVATYLLSLVPPILYA
jgi:hypothetical protein